MENKCGIYIITSKKLNKHYIGYSTNIRARINYHKSLLSRKVHCNEHLQKAYRKRDFIFDTLEECSENLLLSQEHYWCNLLNVHNRDFGFNIARTNPNKLNQGNNRKYISD
jgi:group I intron endonuclease